MNAAAMLCTVFLANCSPSPTTTDPVVVVPPVVLNAKLMALDSFDHPAQNLTDWKTSITRRVFKNQTTGFIIKGELCLLADKAFKLLPINIDKPSAKEYKKGIYYDALVPLTKENCKDAVFAWLETPDSFTESGLQIKIEKATTEAGSPRVPLVVQLAPYEYTKAIHKGVYVANTENLSLEAMKLLVEHRLQPLKSWVTDYRTYSGQYGFKEYVHDFSVGPVSVPNTGDLIQLNKDITTYKIYKPWAYVVDEPDTATLKAAQSILLKLKKEAPLVTRMVTTTYKAGTDIDLFCPVMEQLGHGYPARSAYSRLCLYISCMSSGCGENRQWTNGKYTHIDYNRSGTPDILLDAPSSDAFGFYMQGIAQQVEMLLYYNSIEQWSVKNVDSFTDQYNFGGNGDGTLLYPDYPNKKPLPSLRLKRLRDASYFADAVYSGSSIDLIKAKVKSTKEWSFDMNLYREVMGKLK